MHISFSNISQLSIFRCEAYLLSTTFYPLFSFVTPIIWPSSLFTYNYNFLPFLIHLICSPSVLKFNFPLNPKVRLRWEFIKGNKKVRKQENNNSINKVIKNKKKVFLFFLVAFLVEFFSSFFLVFLLSCFLL